MGVGTSLGQSYDDEFHYSQSQWDSKYDTNVAQADLPTDKPDKASAISIKPVQPFETPLTPQEEGQFQEWKGVHAPNDSGEDYDFRGAFKAGATPDPATNHWVDTFKKPNHPTFSDQSQYAKDAPDMAGSWDGDEYHPAPYGKNPPPSKFFDRLFGLNGEERYKTWPEEAVRGIAKAFDVAQKVSSGEVPMWEQDENGDFHTSIEGMKHAWELVPLAMGGQIPLKIHLGQPSEVTTLRSLSEHVDEFDAMVRRYREGGFTSAQRQEMSASQRIARENPEPPGHHLTPEEAANRFHNLPQGENIRFAHEYEELATDAQFGEYESLVNDSRRQVPYEERIAESRAMSERLGHSDHAAAARSDAAAFRQFEADMQREERLLRRTEEYQRNAMAHGSVTPAEQTRINAARDLTPEAEDYANEIRDLLTRVREQESYKTKAVGADIIHEGQVSLARLKNVFNEHETIHRFRFFDKESNSKGILSISERKNGKQLYVDGIGLNDGIRPQDIGYAGTKDLLYALKKEFPEAETVAGFRVSGGRGKAGKPGHAEMKLPKRARQ